MHFCYLTRSDGIVHGFTFVLVITESEASEDILKYLSSPALC